MENKITKLIELVQKLPENCLDETIDFVNEKIAQSSENKPIPPCPHCKVEDVKRNGRKKDKQRYLCNNCGKTFGETTNTALSQSHCGEAVWKQVIRDTINGVSLDDTAESIAVTHPTAFNMRHKVLMALESAEEREPTVLSGVCELDDTYVLESYKGTKLPEDFWRKPRKHGAVAQKRGISNEYICISAGVERDGEAYSQTVTRAAPGKDDLIAVFGERIGEETLILCDGAVAYAALGENCDCPVKNVCENGDKGGKGFYNINTANSFHSSIKERYDRYRGVATKYLNRYNALFSKTFRRGGDLVDEIYNLLISNDIPSHKRVIDVKTLNLLDI